MNWKIKEECPIVNTNHNILGIAGVDEEILKTIDKMMERYDVNEADLKDQLLTDDYDLCCFGCYPDAIRNIVVNRVNDKFEDYVYENELDEEVLVWQDVLDNFYSLDAIIDLERLDNKDMEKLYNFIQNNRKGEKK